MTPQPETFEFLAGWKFLISLALSVTEGLWSIPSRSLLPQFPHAQCKDMLGRGENVSGRCIAAGLMVLRVCPQLRCKDVPKSMDSITI